MNNKFISVQVNGHDEPSLVNVNMITYIGVSEGKTFIYFSAADRIYSPESFEDLKKKLYEAQEEGASLKWAKTDW